MDVDWHLLYYERTEGECPLREFIDSRKIREQAKILGLISFLQQKGPTLSRPYTDLLEDGIHELRIRLSGDYKAEFSTSFTIGDLLCWRTHL